MNLQDQHLALPAAVVAARPVWEAIGDPSGQPSVGNGLGDQQLADGDLSPLDDICASPAAPRRLRFIFGFVARGSEVDRKIVELLSAPRAALDLAGDPSPFNGDGGRPGCLVAARANIGALLDRSRLVEPAAPDGACRMSGHKGAA